MKKKVIIGLLFSFFTLSLGNSATADSAQKSNPKFSSCTYVINGKRPFLSSNTLGYGPDFNISELSCDGNQIEIISQTISKKKDSVLIKTKNYGAFKLIPDANNPMDNILIYNGVKL